MFHLKTIWSKTNFRILKALKKKNNNNNNNNNKKVRNYLPALNLSLR